MPIIKTRINKDSDKFVSNFEFHKALSTFRTKNPKVREMGFLILLKNIKLEENSQQERESNY